MLFLSLFLTDFYKHELNRNIHYNNLKGTYSISDMNRTITIAFIVDLIIGFIGNDFIYVLKVLKDHRRFKSFKKMTSAINKSLL